MFHCTGNMQLHGGHGGTGPGGEQPLTISQQTDQVWAELNTTEEDEEDKDGTVDARCRAAATLLPLPGPSELNLDNHKMENWRVAQRDPVSHGEGKWWSSDVPRLVLLFKGVRIWCHVRMHIYQKGFMFYTIFLFWESINNQVCL